MKSGSHGLPRYALFLMACLCKLCGIVSHQGVPPTDNLGACADPRQSVLAAELMSKQHVA